MNNISNGSLLKSSSCKKQYFNKTCILKKALLYKSNKFVKNFSNIFYSPQKDNFKFERNKNDSELVEDNYKKIILPYISTDRSSLINSSKNTETKESNKNNPKYVKIHKIKISKNNKSTTKFSYQNDKNLIRLYNENLEKKKKLELYKEKNNNNLNNFSFRNYNINLLKLSSINLSKSNFKIFRKNMKNIQCAFNGITFKRNNKWVQFLEKIEDIAPENLKKKIISFSRDKIEELF